MALIVLLSVGLGWFGWKLREAGRQRRAVEAIERVGGWVAYDYNMPEDGGPAVQAEPPTPAWLRKLVGVDFLSEVVGVNCSFCTEVGDEVLQHIKGVPKLRWLVLHDTRITDAGLVNINGLKDLEYLHLNNTQVTDAGLEELRTLTRLKWLDVARTNVTDTGVEHIKRLRNLEKLYLGGTHVTDKGIKELGNALPNCQIDY